MVGTVVYATDPQTQEFLAELIEKPIDRWTGDRAPRVVVGRPGGGASP
jgi:hypothetical protein